MFIKEFCRKSVGQSNPKQTQPIYEHFIVKTQSRKPNKEAMNQKVKEGTDQRHKEGDDETKVQHNRAEKTIAKEENLRNVGKDKTHHQHETGRNYNRHFRIFEN